MNLLKVFSNKNNIYTWFVCMISIILTGCQLKEVSNQLEETLNVSKGNEQELYPSIKSCKLLVGKYG